MRFGVRLKFIVFFFIGLNGLVISQSKFLLESFLWNKTIKGLLKSYEAIELNFWTVCFRSVKKIRKIWI